MVLFSLADVITFDVVCISEISTNEYNTNLFF
jgi:hypothetical protein